MINEENLITSKEFVENKLGAYKLNEMQEMLLGEQLKVIESFLTNIEYEEDIDKRFSNVSRSSMTCQAYIFDFYLFLRFHIKEIDPEGTKKTDYITIRLRIEMSDLKDLAEYITKNYDFLK